MENNWPGICRRRGAVFSVSVGDAAAAAGWESGRVDRRHRRHEVGGGHDEAAAKVGRRHVLRDALHHAVDLQVQQDQRVFQQSPEHEKYARQNPGLKANKFPVIIIEILDRLQKMDFFPSIIIFLKRSNRIAEKWISHNATLHFRRIGLHAWVCVISDRLIRIFADLCYFQCFQFLRLEQAV